MALSRYINPNNDLPMNIRVTPHGQVSVVDVMMVVCFTSDSNQLSCNARSNATTYLTRIRREHPKVDTFCVGFKFVGRGQQPTLVAGRSGVLRLLQMLRGKRAARFRESTATLVEGYVDADMGLAEDIVDRALDARMQDIQRDAELNAAALACKRLESRDTTKSLCQALKERGAGGKDYGLINGAVNKAVTGMDTRNYRGVQVNLNKNEAAREAFTDSMLGFSGTMNCLVCDNLTGGGDINGQLTFMHHSCAAAASILGLHEIAKVVQPRSHIASNKQVMRDARTAAKYLRLQQGQDSQSSTPRLVAC